MKPSDLQAEMRSLVDEADYHEIGRIGPFVLTIEQPQFFFLLLQLQLALTHPANTGPALQFTLRLGAKLWHILLFGHHRISSDPMLPTTFWLSAPELLVLLAQLQLALTHPINRGGGVADLTRDFARRIQEYLSVNPTLKRICELGWEKEFL